MNSTASLNIVRCSNCSNIISATSFKIEPSSKIDTKKYCSKSCAYPCLIAKIAEETYKNHKITVSRDMFGGDKCRMSENLVKALIELEACTAAYNKINEFLMNLDINFKYSTILSFNNEPANIYVHLLENCNNYVISDLFVVNCRDASITKIMN